MFTISRFFTTSVNIGDFVNIASPHERWFETLIEVIDDYHLNLIEPNVASFISPFVEESTDEESETETKVVRRGRPPKPKATEDGVQTK